MKDPSWTQLTMRIPESYQDLLTGQLRALGFEGFLQESQSLKCFIGSKKWNRETVARVEYCLKRFHEEFPRLSLKYSTALIRKENWNQTWERSIGIIDAAPGIVIKPSWRRLRARDRGKVVLRIDPKMSFGTGHHETTRLCLRLLREYVQPQMNILDFGSGTGILAIAAVKLGARRCIAVDNDSWTIPNIKENLKRNRVDKKVRVVLGDVGAVPKSSFDMIVANIDLPIIERVYANLIRRLTKGGLLIFSGILTADLLRLHKLIRQAGVTPIDVVEENEWSAIALVRV